MIIAQNPWPATAFNAMRCNQRDRIYFEFPHGIGGNICGRDNVYDPDAITQHDAAAFLRQGRFGCVTQGAEH